MFPEKTLKWGKSRNCIRELFEYGNGRRAAIGAENVYDFSLGNPSIPSPDCVTESLHRLVEQDPLALPGYTSAPGDLGLRQAVADDLNERYSAGVRANDLFIGCGAAPELCAVFSALAVPNAEILAVAPYFPEYMPYVEHCGGIFRAVPADIPNFQIDLAALEAMLREAHPIREVITGYVGPVIGAHTGPGVLVVFFLGTHR